MWNLSFGGHVANEKKFSWKAMIAIYDVFDYQAKDQMMNGPIAKRHCHRCRYHWMHVSPIINQEYFENLWKVFSFFPKTI